MEASLISSTQLAYYPHHVQAYDKVSYIKGSFRLANGHHKYSIILALPHNITQLMSHVQSS